MQIIHDNPVMPSSVLGVALALGNFDGLHRGHRAILEATLQQAKALHCPTAVMSFEPHPREFFAPDAPKLRLMRLRDKIDALKQMGFDAVFLPRFNQQLAATSAQDFVADWLVRRLSVRAVVTGNDFCFGAGRSGNHTSLAEAAQQHGFSYYAVAPVCSDAGVISSSSIRALLAEGTPEHVAPLLGRNHRICGHVTHGDKRGRTLGFPTANLSLRGLFVPRHGVYAVTVEGKQGVANIGVRPTVSGARPQLEVHLLDFNGDLYGQYLRVELHRFLRPEQRFESLEALQAQIIKDCQAAWPHS